MRTAIVITLLLLLWSPSWALDIRGTCYITFLGTSTLHDFTGTVRSKPFTVSLTEGERSGNFIHRVEVEVPVDEIDTDNKKRDKKLRKMFQSDQFPGIHGMIKEIRPDKLRKELQARQNGAVTMDLTLKIRDIDRVIPVNIGNYREYGQQISFSMEFPVSLKAYNLKPPAPLFGLIRVGDRINVKITFDLEIKPAELFSQKENVQE
jgi:polyisoprenoid-binding protein YceI